MSVSCWQGINFSLYFVELCAQYTSIVTCQVEATRVNVLYIYWKRKIYLKLRLSKLINRLFQVT